MEPDAQMIEENRRLREQVRSLTSRLAAAQAEKHGEEDRLRRKNADQEIRMARLQDRINELEADARDRKLP